MAGPSSTGKLQQLCSRSPDVKQALVEWLREQQAVSLRGVVSAPTAETLLGVQGEVRVLERITKTVDNW